MSRATQASYEPRLTQRGSPNERDDHHRERGPAKIIDGKKGELRKPTPRKKVFTERTEVSGWKGKN